MSAHEDLEVVEDGTDETDLTPTETDLLKQEVREWYGLISVKELVENHKLLRELEALEKLFSSAS